MGTNCKKIYFIRHAMDDSRYRGGWSDRPLVKYGDIQSKRIAKFVATHSDNMCIKTIISSDLVRAVQTAQPLSEELNIPIIQNAAWREANNGKLAGMHNREAEKRYPGVYWSTLELNEKYPDGESPLEFYERISQSFKQLKLNVLENKIESNSAIFTHSGVINIIYSTVYNKRWTNKFRSFDIPYASVHEYDIAKNAISQIF